MNKWALLLFCFFVHAQQEDKKVLRVCDDFIFHEPSKILGYQNREEFERRIVFLEDNTHQKFVLKCYGQDQKEEALCEYLGSYIGTSVGIPVHEVQIMIDGPLLAEVNNGTSLATLHVRVPGQQLGKWFEAVAHDITLKGGLISERHLNSIAISDDLCDLVALDIFLNNRDRHSENCFFDESTGHYYGIDMGDIFLAVRTIDNNDQIVCAETYDKISELVAQERIVALKNYYFLQSLDPYSLSIHQKKALKRVSTTLEQLLFLYPAETVLDMWLQIAHEVDYIYRDYKKIYLTMFLDRNRYWVGKVIEIIKNLVGE